MTDAERQARYSAARASGTPPVRMRRPLDHRSRAKHWSGAVSELITLGSVCRLAGGSAGEPPGQRHRRGVARDLRPRPHRTAGNRSAARLRPRLTRTTSAARDPAIQETAPDRPTSPPPHRTVLAPAAQPDQLRRGERYYPARLTKTGVNLGRRSGVNFGHDDVIAGRSLPYETAVFRIGRIGVSGGSYEAICRSGCLAERDFSLRCG